MFEDQLGKSMEVYINDMLVKSRKAEYLQANFQRVKKIQTKVKMTKCTFEVAAEKFLEHLVTQRGIKANPT